jgi:hypothetical protein
MRPHLSGGDGVHHRRGEVAADELLSALRTGIERTFVRILWVRLGRNDEARA